MRILSDCSVWVLHSLPTARVPKFDRNEFGSAGPGRHFAEVRKPRKAQTAAQVMRILGWAMESCARVAQYQHVVAISRREAVSGDCLRLSERSRDTWCYSVTNRLNQALEVLRKKPSRRAA